MISKLKLVSAILAKILIGISMILTILMTILVVVMVVTRYGFGFVIRGTEELTLLLLIWMALLGAAAVLQRREHIAVTFLLDRISTRLNEIIQIVLSLMIIIYLLFLTRYSVIHAVNNIDNRSTALGFSLFWPYSSIYISSGAMLLFSVINLIDDCVKIFTKKDK